MSKRAILFGFTGVMILASLAYFNDRILKQSYLIGHHFPFFIHGIFIILVVINWQCWQWYKKQLLTSAEFALIIGMVLAACCIPNAGLLRVFTTQISLPHLIQRNEPAWKKYRLVDEIVPPGMLVSADKEIQPIQIQDATDQSVTFTESPLLPPDLTHRKIRIIGSKGDRQVRLITQYDATTRTAHIDEPWRQRPNPNTEVAILQSEEELCITPLIHGYAGSLREDVSFFKAFKMIPWRSWITPLTFWIPIILLSALGSIALALVVQKQWAEHEHLPYPLAQVVCSFLFKEDSEHCTVLQDRKFWVVCGIVLLIYLNNYLVVWFPKHWVSIPLTVELDPLVRSLPGLKNAHDFLASPRIFFIPLAISYFLAGDVSLSIGLGPYLFLICSTLCASYGINLSASEMGISRGTSLIFGAYLGMVGMFIWTGRHYYREIVTNLFKNNLLPSSVPKEAIWGLRIFLLCVLGMVFLLYTKEVNLFLAILYVLLFFLMVLVLGRVIAETGFFFNQCNWLPAGMLLAIFGGQSISPTAMFVMCSISAALIIDSRETLLPFMMNIFKINDLYRHSRSQVATLAFLSVILVLLIALPVTLTWQYYRGVDMSDGWGTSYVPKYPFSQTLQLIMYNEGRGTLDEVRSLASWQTILNFHPIRNDFLVMMLIGMVLVCVIAFLRHRFPGFILHPVLFIMWATYSAGLMAFSFLLGWLIKIIILRFWGTRTYQSLKPIFFGLITGELLGCLIPTLAGFIYYGITGELPPVFRLGLG